MMITIYGLPPKTTFQAVKTLVKQECNIIDFILDSLVDDGPNAKKVRLGVSDDSEGYRIMKYLNGFRMSPTHLLKIVPVGKPLNPPSEQSTSIRDKRPMYSNDPQNDYQSHSQTQPDYQSPMDNYGDQPNDTRKGNYVPPHIRKKNIEKRELINAGSFRPPHPRPPNLEHRVGPHGSHMSRPLGPSSYVSGHMSGPHSTSMHAPSHSHGSHSAGPSSHMSGPHVSSPHVSGSHSQSANISGPSSHMSGPDMRSPPQWGHDVNSDRMGDSEWGQTSQRGMQAQGGYNQRPSQGGFGQQQPQNVPDPYATSQGRGPPQQGYGFQPKPEPEPAQVRLPPQQQRDTRQHVLRAVDIVDTPPARQYPPEKPITIMKDNFQGPQYSGPPQQASYPGQAAVWQMNQQPKPYDDRHPMDKRVEPPKQDFEKRGQFIPTGRPLSPTNRSYQEPNRQFPERRYSPSRIGVREFSPSGRRSPGRRFSPGRKISPGKFSPGRKMSPGRRFSPERKMSPGRQFSPGRKMSPGRRFSPGRKMSPGRRFSPGRKMSPGRRFSPGRKISPGRRFSPGRKMSPGRRFSPGRKMSPGRRFSPGRKMSPGRRSPGRRFSPGGKQSPVRFSPKRKMSPGRFSPRREMSPGRKISPGRFSPDNSGEGHQVSTDKKLWIKDWSEELEHLKSKAHQLHNKACNTNRIEDWDNFKHAQRLYKRELTRVKRSSMRDQNKEIRDAMEKNIGGASGDPDDRMMGGRYSPGRESPTRRLVSPNKPRFSPNRLGDKPSDKFLNENTGVKPIRPAYEPTQAQNQYTGGYRDSAQYPRQESRPSPWQNEKIIFPSSAPEEDRRDLRRLDKPVEKSPRRSRSPLKDRYRRHSLSPRSRSSRSPRRSWALEKRSPEPIREPPPPPAWPGQETDPPRKPTRFNSPTIEPQQTNVWKRLVEPRTFQEKHARSDLDEPRPFQDNIRARSDMQDKFPRRELDDKREYRDEDRMQSDRDREFRRDDRQEYRRESPRRDRDPKKIFTDIDKDFQDVYQRAVEFRKKTEERTRSGDRHRDEPQRRSRSRESKEVGTKSRKRIFLSPSIKAKRDKAIDEVVERILNNYELTDDQWQRISEELKMTLATIFIEMFTDKDVSFIELVIKYQAKYPPKEEEKMFKEVLANLPKQYRNLKRKPDRGDPSEKSAKSDQKKARKSPPRSGTEETKRPENPRPKLSDAIVPEWQTNIEPPKVMSMSLSVAPAVNMAAPGMVPSPVYVPTSAGMVPTPVGVTTGVYNHQLHYNMAQMQSFSNQMQQAQPSVSHMQPTHVDVNQMQPQFIPNQMQTQFSTNQMQPLLTPNQMQQPLVSANQPALVNPGQQFESSRGDEYDPFEGTQQSNDGYNLYLCQDDFEPFSTVQAENLKDFIFKQIIKQTESSNGWAPDLILRGLQSAHRYEISTKDEKSRDWIVNLDFSDFQFFNVLVYTKEELWYERAAIWLPGHSRSRALLPLDKLKLQNKFLKDINISKWKFVKAIVTVKGTRLYVDMPPSSARALEKYKMMLSYELQKVNVILKAVAVDKQMFDEGLNDYSLTDAAQLAAAVQNSVMPILNVNTEPGIIKVGLNGHKTLTIEEARKLKEVVVYHLTKYLQLSGNMRTDFVKYGFCPPNHIGIVPENDESKKWLMSRVFGKMSRATIVVYGNETDTKKYFKMIGTIPFENQLTSAVAALERIKFSNQGIKGIHFNFWRPLKISVERKKTTFEVDMDLESVDALSKMKYRLDFVGQNSVKTVTFQSEYSHSKLEEKIKKYKMEQIDSYDVANMDLASDSDQEGGSN